MTPMLTAGSLVRATRQIAEESDEVLPGDEDCVILELFADPGDLGRVLHVVDGEHLVVAFENAPCATEVFLGDDCAPFLTLHRGGISASTAQTA